MKKVTSVVLDEDLLFKAKKEIPNLSGFFENCLKVYLGYNKDLGTIQKELNKIKDSELKIHLLTGNEKKNTKNKIVDDKKVNDAWRKTWRISRKTNAYDFNSINELAKLSCIESDVIMHIIEQCLLEQDLSDDKLEDWNYVLKEYNDNDL